ncbi:hypothetical protein FVR03_11030 [Pontibacter qinzhouensis]|uniref:Uncharacterized protein n=1 Tax=Pontibacter qinzhouensis TaxID=2603253 RepID=A0A5C8KAT9_9BACT|nr:hypothetical protein [Pontibacter qinzhouensis]TXK46087.1 hypothetical protein FVR03_11030 [Pontibacter qinzhouensis]
MKQNHYESPVSATLHTMEQEGSWRKDEEGYMDFNPPQLQRLYEAVTDQYHQVYNQYLEEFDDDDEAYYKALDDGYEMTTDYKLIDEQEQFTTTYITPSFEIDIWYEVDELTNKRVYDKGFIRVRRR